VWIFAVGSFVLLLVATLLAAKPDYAIGKFSLLLASPFLLGGWCLGVWLFADALRNLRQKRWSIISAAQVAVGVALLGLVIWISSKWR
jgi:hypothetical protein